ncbi:SDR family oxidoreductase [Spongisporangium articulatum]|uniref:SDR family oxidoreductase n=1 Tax=Spongisporangium articulatum TaxID=3362603 RepID=A0ABW8AH50_9ACTN
MSARPTRRNILITGASSGLGEQMAREFARRGRNLALCARRTDRLEKLRAELLERNPRITVSLKALDVTDTDAVFEVFRSFAVEFEEHGGLDRVIVNAGLGKGQPLGSGRFDANLQTAQTNFIGALAQFEAALETFRARGSGHLVAISSMSAMRGMPRNLTTYAATKAGVATLAEGARADLLGTDIVVSTIYPGYIRSEMNEKVKNTPLIVSTEKGVAAMVAAIEKEKASAKVPAWPWVPMGLLMRVLPLPVVARMA